MNAVGWVPSVRTLMLATGQILVMFVSNAALAAEDETIYLDETYISGNQELPKVLYILPWKDQSGGAVPAIQPGSTLDQIMKPVYPHEYRLALAWRSQIAANNAATLAANQNSVTKAEIPDDSISNHSTFRNTSEPGNGFENSIDQPRSNANKKSAQDSLQAVGQPQSILKED